MKKYNIPYTRLGGTSFIVQENYVNGVRYAATHCDDVALLLNYVGEKGECLPTKEEIIEIKHIIEGEGVTLHVHLPTDGDCATEKNTETYYKNILMALERVDSLNVHTFVQHIDIIPLRFMNTLPSIEQQENIRQMLGNIAKHIQSPKMLALENLESFPFNFLDFCFQGTEYSRCVDIGHIWKDGGNPTPFICAWFKKIRLIHLHGLRAHSPFQVQDSLLKNILPSVESIRRMYGTKVHDHKSLEDIPVSWLDAVLHLLWHKQFQGVINLEIFNPLDFQNSLQLVLQSYERFEQKQRKYQIEMP